MLSVKNLKKLCVAVVCDDEKLILKLRANRQKFLNLYFVKFDDFLSFYLNCNTNLDVIVLDLDILSQNDEEFDFERISSIAPNQKFIFLASNKKIYSKVLKNFTGGVSTLMFKPIKMGVLLDNIAMLSPVLEVKFLRLNEKIKIDLEKEQIFDGERQIFLTNLQHKLILLLSQNIGNLTTFEMIDEIVYNSECKSKISMQNLVGNLKRNLNLNIKNIHSKGYIMYDFT